MKNLTCVILEKLCRYRLHTYIEHLINKSPQITQMMIKFRNLRSTPFMNIPCPVANIPKGGGEGAQ